MKAVLINGYGGPEVLQLGEAPIPEPGPSEILVEIHAAGVNPLDWKIREGMMTALFDFPMPHVLSRDFSGVVTALGNEVTGVSVGDAVYGIGNIMGNGTQAEFAAVPAATVAAKPANIDHIAAASLPIAGLSALSGLIEFGELAAGQKVLIHAGAGGVGCIAVQLAKHLGATVYATASAANKEYVRGLGADEVIDYRAGDFAAGLSDMDLVFDVMGGDVHRRSYSVLRQGGRMTWLNAAPVEADPSRGDVDVRASPVTYTTASLDQMTGFIESGAIVPQVEVVMDLDDAPRAYELSQTGHVRGKIVLKVR